MRQRRPWTPEEERELLDRLRAGDAYRAIAADFGRRESTCRHKAAMLRNAGRTAIGAHRKPKGAAPAPTRRCLACRDPFAPEGRFLFLCRLCRRAATAGVRRDPADGAQAA